jgi:hypothetical protein
MYTRCYVIGSGAIRDCLGQVPISAYRKLSHYPGLSSLAQPTRKVFSFADAVGSIVPTCGIASNLFMRTRPRHGKIKASTKKMSQMSRAVWHSPSCAL